MTPFKHIFPLMVICALGVSAKADKLDQDGILRKDDGSIHYMSQYEAMGIDDHGNKLPEGPACPAGTHLPTIRELAKISQSGGAKGILETTEVKDGAVPEGYYLVDVKNPDGSQDKFYFNYHGYKRPDGDLGNNWFWSSSVYSNFSYGAYVLYGNGAVPYVSRYGNGAVRCVAGQ